MQDHLAEGAAAETLPPARHRHAKEESNEKAGKRCLAGDRCDSRESPARPSRFLDGRRHAADGCVQAASDFTDRAGDVRRCIDGTLGHAGFGRGLRYLRAQGRVLQA